MKGEQKKLNKSRGKRRLGRQGRWRGEFRRGEE